MSLEAEQRSRAMLNPVLDVFSGADGGASFVRLQKGLLPALYSKAEEDRTQQEEDLLRTIEQFSRLCQAMLRGYRPLTFNRTNPNPQETDQ